MDSVFTQQEEREENQQQQEQQEQLLQEEEDHQQKLCVPFLKPGSFDNSNPFSNFRFWVSKSFKNLNCKGAFSSGFGLKSLECNFSAVNTTVYCSSPGKATMERVNVIGEIESYKEIKHQVLSENERRIETFVKLIEEKGRESTSSSDFLTYETTGHEQQHHASSEESFSPNTLDWPVQKAETPECNSVDGIQNEKKLVMEDRETEKQGSNLSEIEMMKERFAKLLLGEDMSGSGNGVCTALAISNVITNLCATIFGQLWRLEPLPLEKKTMWQREMEWLLSVTDHIVDLMPSWQTFPDGSKLEVMTSRPRSDLYVYLPALRKLDNMLLEIFNSFENTEFWYVDPGILPLEADGSASFHRSLQRQEEKWWLPVPRVPPGGLHEITRKQLQHKRDCTNQILKAAMAINSITLADMEVPESYLESLPKNGRACLGDIIYRYISSDQFSPECLLECLDLSSEHQAIEMANRLEASIYVWRKRTYSKPVNNTTRNTSKSSWELVKELVVDADKRELLADRAESHLLYLRQWFPGLPQTTLDMSKIQYNKDVGKSILESYSRVLESLAFNIVARIDDLLYVDDVTKHSDPHSRVAKVGVIAQKSISIPHSVPLASTPCRTAYTTPCFSPAPLLRRAKGEGSPFCTSSKVPWHGAGVKKVLTDYPTIETTGTECGNLMDEANSILNSIREGTPPQLGLESLECIKRAISSPTQDTILEEESLKFAL